MSKRPFGSFESRLAGLSLRDAIRLALRTVFTVMYEPRKEVLAEARVHVPITKKDGTPGLRYNVMYRCAKCKELHEKVDVDHISEVGGFFDWPSEDKTQLTEWAERLFCDKSNLQPLCRPCHQVKSGKATRKRAKVRRRQRTKARPTRSPRLD